MKINKNQNGFTIVELLVIVVIIGILSALLVVTFNGYKQKTRNSEREADIKLLHTSVEAYFSQNSKYPTLANMNDNAWLSINMKSLEKNTLRDPSNVSAALVSSPTQKAYSYEAKASDDTACDNSTKDCAKYTLTASYETQGFFTRSNLN